jgi:2,3-bisphosphoglycerate-dependent phosphoglycerate mutase
MVGFQVGFLWYEVGTSTFLKSWFSTINFHLEKKKWGSKFPIIMEYLYQGEVPENLLLSLKKEVLLTKDRLRKLSPKDVIWDIDDLSQRPPWGNDISSGITDLSNYYVTCNGEDFYDVLLSAIDESITEKEKLLINEI